LRGFITLASTRRDYLDMAVDLALSLRAVARDPIALILDDTLRAQAKPAELRLFDHIATLPPNYPRNIGKLFAPHASPFDESLFLDSDCLALAPFDALWERLRPLEFALQGEVLTPAIERIHNMRSTRETMRRFGLKRFVKSTSGLIYFRRDTGRAVADAAMHCFREAFDSRMNCDETLLGIAADAHAIGVIPPPLPMPWWPGQLEVGDTRFTVVHMMDRVKPDTMRWLMDGVRRRRMAAGLQPEASIGAWRRKATHWTWKKVKYRVVTSIRERAVRRRARRAAANAERRPSSISAFFFGIRRDLDG